MSVHVQVHVGGRLYGCALAYCPSVGLYACQFCLFIDARGGGADVAATERSAPACCESSPAVDIMYVHVFIFPSGLDTETWSTFVS